MLNRKMIRVGLVKLVIAVMILLPVLSFGGQGQAALASEPDDAVVSAPAEPAIISPTQTRITAEGAPLDIVVRAEAESFITILDGEEVVGSGRGVGTHNVVITLAALDSGVHMLKVAVTSSAYTPGMAVASVNLPPVIVDDSLPFDIEDVVKLGAQILASQWDFNQDEVLPSAEDGEDFSYLLGLIHSHQSVTDQVSGQSTAVSVDNGDLSATLTLDVLDQNGDPITDLAGSDVVVDLLEGSYTVVVASGLSDFRQIADGVYEVTFAPGFAVNNGAAAIRVRGVTIAESLNVSIAGIASISDLTRNMETSTTPYTLPTQVEARMSDNSLKMVDVAWNDSNGSVTTANISQSGTNTFTGTVTGYAGTVNLILTVTAPADVRIVLTWGTSPKDLDAHLFGYVSGQSNLHVFYGNEWYPSYGNKQVDLERDDTNGEGPETITIKGSSNVKIFRFGVHNYSSTYGNEEADLSSSAAKVEVYKGDQRLLTYDIPVDSEHEDVYWSVFQMIGDQITPIDKMRMYTRFDANLQQAINYAIGLIHALPPLSGLGQEQLAEVTAARAQVDAAKGSGAVDGDFANLAVLQAAEAKLAGLPGPAPATPDLIPGTNLGTTRLIGIDDTMEWKKSSDTAYTPVPSGVIEVDNIPVNVGEQIEVRYMATESLLASTAKILTVAEANIRVDLSGAIVSAPNSLFAGMPFSLNITGAANVDGSNIGTVTNSVYREVTVTASVYDDDTGSQIILYGGESSPSLLFTGGEASLDGLTIEAVGTYNLTITIEGITAPIIIPNVIVGIPQSAANDSLVESQGSLGLRYLWTARSSPYT